VPGDAFYGTVWYPHVVPTIETTLFSDRSIRAKTSQFAGNL
jgi:hypothetical protein